MMSPDKWNAMSNTDKITHFENNEIEVVSKSFMTANTKVNDPHNAVNILYQAYCGGVIVSHWCKTQQQAYEMASGCIATSIQHLVIQEEAA
ncbi:MAG: hypothetical protein RLN68_02925 [Balneola sp.]